MATQISDKEKQLIKNKVRFIQCNDWNDFVQKIKEDVSVNIKENEPNEITSNVIFRGHAKKKWKLSSRLERAFSLSIPVTHSNGNIVIKKIGKDIWYENVQKDILSKFKFLSKGIAGINLENKNENEIWAIGRHNGLITPILDWTVSPYIAAFFAFNEQFQQFEFNVKITPLFLKKGKVYVWALRCYSNLEVKNEFDIINMPREFGSRLWAQSGLFTRLLTAKYFDIQSYLKSRGIAHYLDCYELPFNCAAESLKDLELMNISYSKLFPDLTGIAMDANIYKPHVEALSIQNQIINKTSSR